jgi:hypothetical protein
MTSVTVCRRKSGTQPAITVVKLSIEGAVKQPEKACSKVTNEATMGVSNTIAPERGCLW